MGLVHTCCSPLLYSERFQACPVSICLALQFEKKGSPKATVGAFDRLLVFCLFCSCAKKTPVFRQSSQKGPKVPCTNPTNQLQRQVSSTHCKGQEETSLSLPYGWGKPRGLSGWEHPEGQPPQGAAGEGEPLLDPGKACLDLPYDSLIKGSTEHVAGWS